MNNPHIIGREIFFRENKSFHIWNYRKQHFETRVFLCDIFSMLQLGLLVIFNVSSVKIKIY